MINKAQLLRQVERDLRATRAIGPSTRQAWDDWPPEARIPFIRAMEFLGCPNGQSSQAPRCPTPSCDRVAAARLMLLKLGADTDDPRWSSAVLDRLVAAVMETPQGSVTDLFEAMVGVMNDFRVPLSNPVAELIKDLVVRSFTRYRSEYESANWPEFTERIAGNPTPAQLYFALRAIPPQSLPQELADAILKGLESTPFHDEAATAFAV